MTTIEVDGFALGKHDSGFPGGSAFDPPESTVQSGS
jgi:hypothetical protein